MTLQKAQGKIAKGDTESAVLLSLSVFSPVIRMLNFSDDSNGTVGDIIHLAINTVDQAVNTAIDDLDNKEQKKLFDAILKEALKEYYDGWSDWRFDLLKVCTYFPNSKDLRKKLEKQLETLEQKASTSWNADYEKEQVKLLQLEIIERCKGLEKAERFIYENIHYSDFRE